MYTQLGHSLVSMGSTLFPYPHAIGAGFDYLDSSLQLSVPIGIVQGLAVFYKVF